VTAVNSRIREVSAAMWLSTTGRRGRQERPLVPLAHPEAVEPQLLGEQRVVQHLLEALTGGLAHPGQRIRGVHDQRDGEEPHDAATRRIASAGRGVRSPRWSRSVPPP